jgi:hypothetical protein
MGRPEIQGVLEEFFGIHFDPKRNRKHDPWHIKKNRKTVELFAGSTAFSAVEKKSSVFCVVTRCKVVLYRHFGSTPLKDGGQWIVPKRRFQTTLRRVITQKMEEFIDIFRGWQRLLLSHPRKNVHFPILSEKTGKYSCPCILRMRIGRGGIAPLILNLGARRRRICKRHARAALPPGRNPDTHRVGG